MANKKVALFIDEFYTQEQIVVKSLEKNYKKAWQTIQTLSIKTKKHYKKTTKSY